MSISSFGFLHSVVIALLLFLGTGATAGEPAMDEIHLHKDVPLPEGKHPPRLDAQMHADSKDGFNLHLAVADYVFGPPHRTHNTDPALLEGHAHLYINGHKQSRLYSPDVHIPAKWLKSGINQITVTLNSHEHDTWTRDGKPFLVTVFVDPGTDPPIRHVFSSSPLRDEQ